MLLDNIIKVEPVNPSIVITWMLGARCNYDCMYCPTEWHDSTSQHPDLEQLIKVWDNMITNTAHQELGYKINFTGGEVTANKSFIPLLRHIRSSNVNITHVGITTNGSASKNYYLELATLLDSISFSTHSEFFNEKEFFSKVHSINQVMQRPQKSVHVNIMDEFWNQERLALYIKWLEDHKISHSINTINYNRKTRDLPNMQGVYNIEQL
jgi:MoaA/NifB/PqqE/SkfB family radical SAM enzyme